MTTRFDGVLRTAFERCVPLYVTFEITQRCNLRCVHCYNFDRERPYGRSAEELADEEILRILGEVHEAGCLFLSLTGGEVLAHPRLDDFIRCARSLGMKVTLKSNGTLLTDERVAALRDAGANAIDLSLYGAVAATHDAFVKQAGAHAATLDGARRARDAGIEVRLAVVVVRSNAGEVEAMLELSRELGVSCTVDPQLTARYDGTSSSLDLRVDGATLERLYRGPLRELLPAHGCHPGRSVQCSCARSVCGISAFGQVYPCIGAPIASGDLRRQSFAEIWRGSPELNRIRGLELSDFAACEPCGHRPHCRRSSGVIYNNTGRYTGPERFGDEWTCMEAELLHRLHDEEAALNAAPQSERAAPPDPRPGSASR
jgi:radical SAM protein with 4Fe4S-binding SPASM domain